jgi:hypothetical protein
MMRAEWYSRPGNSPLNFRGIALLRIWKILLFFPLYFLAQAPILNAQESNRSKRLQCVTSFENGRVNSAWLQALQTRQPVSYIDSLSSLQRELNEAEKEWYVLIQSRFGEWQSFPDSLQVLFPTVQLPDTIQVWLGFLGNDDGYTYQSNVVCLDITAFHRAYGDADNVENLARVDRIFAHEYTHLLQKAWMREQGWYPRSFADSIAWECWYEGIGMYRSLHPRWQPVDGKLPEISQELLHKLEPRFRAYWIKSQESNLSEAEKVAIRRNLSRGKVTEKWGAMTIALWLSLEATKGSDRLQQLIQMGPDMIKELEKLYLTKK